MVSLCSARDYRVLLFLLFVDHIIAHSARERETVQWATVLVLPLLLKSEELRFNQMVVSDKMLSTIRSGPPLQVGGL